MNIKDSEIYKEIIKSNKTLPVAFYTNTGLIINDNNIEYIIDIELKKAKEKVKIINEKGLFDNIEQKIKKDILSKINEPYLILEYVYFNKENIEEGIVDIEKSENFYRWII